MIPKIIHYCWFGRGPMPEDNLKCIESWKKFLPDYKLMLWNEDNYDVNSIKFTRQAYQGARRHLAGYRYRNHQKPRSAAGTARLHEFRIRHAAAHRDRRQRERSRMDRRVLEIHEQKTVHPLERPVEQNPEHGHNLAHSEKTGRKTGQHVPDLRRLPAHLPERLFLPERLQNRKNHNNGQHVLHPPLRRFVEVIRPGSRNGGTETAAGTGFCKF